MPTVRRQRRQIQEQAAQPFQTNINIDPKVPSQELQEAQLAITDDVREFGLNEIDEADNLKVQSFQNRIEQEKIDIENEALQTKGEAALGATGAARTRLRDFTAKLRDEAVTDFQKDALNQLTQRGDTQLKRTVERHTIGEIENQKLITYKALSSNLIESSLQNSTDSNRIAENSISYESAQLKEAARRGFDKEATDAFMLEKMTEFNFKLLNKMITEEDYGGAKGYLDFVSGLGQMSDDAESKVRESLEEGDFRVKAQDNVDRLMTDFNTYQERFEEARKITDPEDRKAALSLLRGNFNDDKALEAAARSTLYLQGANAIEANPGKSARESIPPNVWKTLTVSQRTGLMRHAKNINPEEPETHDMPKFIEFNLLNDVALSKISFSDLQEKFVTRFNSTYRKKAEARWLAAQKHVKEGTSLTRFKTTEEIVVETLVNEDLINIRSKFRSEDERKLTNRFLDRFNRALNELEQSDDKGLLEGVEREATIKSLINKTLMQEVRTVSDRDLERIVDLSEKEFSEAILPFGEGEGEVSRVRVNEILGIIRNNPRTSNLSKNSKEMGTLVRRIAFADLIGDDQLIEDLLSGRVK